MNEVCRFAVIVAGDMAPECNNVPKQFIEILGKPLSSYNRIILKSKGGCFDLSVGKEYFKRWQSIKEKWLLITLYD